jgi:hypothetical protein
VPDLLQRLQVFCLKFPQAIRTQTALEQLTNVLHRIHIQPNGMALTFRRTVRLTLYSRAAALTWDKFMFGHVAKIQQIVVSLPILSNRQQLSH